MEIKKNKNVVLFFISPLFSFLDTCTSSQKSNGFWEAKYFFYKTGKFFWSTFTT